MWRVRSRPPPTSCRDHERAADGGQRAEREAQQPDDQRRHADGEQHRDWWNHENYWPIGDKFELEAAVEQSDARRAVAAVNVLRLFRLSEAKRLRVAELLAVSASRLVNQRKPAEAAEVAALFVSLWPGLLALLISHGYSFFSNFLGREEYRSRTVKDQMSEPYSRIVFMHLVLIFGGGLALVLGEPTLVIIGVIVLKIVFDVRAHLKQRAPGQGTGTVA